MKKKNLLLLALVAITFISCSNEQDLEIPASNGNGAETFSAVSISFPQSVVLRAADPNAANGVESEVTSVGVYIIDDFNGSMHKGVFNNNQFTKLGDTYTLTSALKTTTGSKSVYVVLNPSSPLMDQIELQRGGIFGDSPFSGTAQSDFVTTQDLVMSSVAALPVILTEKNEVEALASPFAITVQRNTAKVAVKQKTAVLPVVGGSIANLEFSLVVEAKKSYLIQQGGNTLATVRTPGYGVYALSAENEYFTKLATPTDWKGVNENTTTNNQLAGFYALENVNSTNLTGNTTAAIIKTQFTPADNSVVISYAPNGDRMMGSITPGTSFYVKKSDNTFWSQSAYGTALASGFTADHFSKIYDFGISYYRIWVQDADNKRGVLRNNIYVLTINKITGPGLPYVPGVNPDDNTNPEDPNLPIEEDTFISVEVNVLPWDVQNSEHEI